ncbi:tyrosine-type recombinase/integrase [Serratia fonticola]|uniref:Integrase arm-type DNA-binding domain-containing protein n=1 Tax=Serratia fonticola TaxID=47917 RepID=A0ABY9PID6_SERFO|nr:integrase arm-type DNA-binding domain-containing protein [Serratia fonticola]WMT13025.1 integrase arm-type DNA-binding domain-containing protein [Serratia fonticola]
MSISDVVLRRTKPQDKPFKISDSAGLYLLVKPNGSKLWYLKYRYDGKERKLAFGAYPAVSLMLARKLRDDSRAELAQGNDPGQTRRHEKQAGRVGKTLEEVARAWHKNNRTWSYTHSTRILRNLEMYLFPSLGKQSIAKITTADFLSVLKAIEDKGFLEVAMRLQQRIVGIMRYAVQNQIIKYNPALDLTGAIATPQKRHHPALPLSRMPDFFTRLNADKGRLLTRLALRLNFYVFVRSSELRFARWEEIDFENALWTIPATRESVPGVRYSKRGAKMKTPHLVPLSTQAIAVLKQIHQLSGHGQFIFPNDHDMYKVMSENTLNKTLQRLGYDTKSELCAHGIRAMACSALLESGRWSRDAIELQMSHQERNSVRAAYNHLAEYLEVRYQMMQWWADYLDENQSAYVAPYHFFQKQRRKKNIKQLLPC